MKERPILFSAPMVRALLAGTKTQTRRIFKPERMTWDANGRYKTHAMRGGELSITGSGPFKPSSWLHYCPYGQPGDRLWVRESFARVPTACGSEDIVFAADYQDGSDRAAGVRYTPSIHMPRAASRITLEVTGVRVERLQDISSDDARAEGCPDKPVDGAEQASIDLLAKLWYHDLWEQINGLDSWAANPWVWVVEFKRVKGDAA